MVVAVEPNWVLRSSMVREKVLLFGFFFKAIYAILFCPCK